MSSTLLNIRTKIKTFKKSVGDNITRENRDEDILNDFVGAVSLISVGDSSRGFSLEFGVIARGCTLFDGASCASAVGFLGNSCLDSDGGEGVDEVLGGGACWGGGAVEVLVGASNVNRSRVAGVSDFFASIRNEVLDVGLDVSLQGIEVDFFFAEVGNDVPFEEASFILLESFNFSAPNLLPKTEETSTKGKTSTNKGCEHGDNKCGRREASTDRASSGDGSENGSDDKESGGSGETDHGILDNVDIVIVFINVVDEAIHATLDLIEFGDGFVEGGVRNVDTSFDFIEFATNPTGEVRRTLLDDISEFLCTNGALDSNGAGNNSHDESDVSNELGPPNRVLGVHLELDIFVEFIKFRTTTATVIWA